MLDASARILMTICRAVNKHFGLKPCSDMRNLMPV